jgi:DNA-binding IclR family transcriptional regulator
MKSLHKTLDIIDTVAEKGPVGIHDIFVITNYPHSTIHRIISTLVERRYLRQDPATKKYSISLKFLELGNRVQEQFDVAAISRPHLQRLMIETEESANLAIQDGDEVVYLNHAKSEKSLLKIFTTLGARAPLYSTGVGKMFLSQWNKSDLDLYLQRTHRQPFTPNTLVSRNDILDELDRIKALGYAVDNEEMETGVRCVAAIVLDHSGQPVAAVSISGPALRITPDQIENFSEKVKQHALAISQELGYLTTSKLI